MIKVGIAGAYGKMGQATIDVINHDPNFVYQKGLVRQKKSNDFFGTESLSNFFIDIDIAIIYATSKVQNILDEAQKTNTPIVMCSTGVNMDKTKYNIPIVYTKNTSDGMNMIFNFLTTHSKQLQENYKIKIKEYHHKDKKDTPSGTSKKILKILDLDSSEIDITRKDDMNASIEIIFENEDEMLQLKHTAKSRNVFAKGALKIARNLIKKQ